MYQVIKKLTYPHCHNAKIVKNGKKSNGQQNYKCKVCHKQFQEQYFYNACNPEIKVLIQCMLLRRNSVRNISQVLMVRSV